MRPSASSSTNDDSILAPRLILGVDAGGTKTVAWIARSNVDGETQVVGRGRAGSGNPLSAGFAQATRAILDAVEQARDEAGLPDSRVARAVLSIAGSTDRAMSQRLTEWAHGVGLASKVALCSDFLPVLAAGTSDGVGIALVSGTGSVAYARTRDGRAERFGGWGYLIGDDGSGYAIGRGALRLALTELESRQSLSALTKLLLDALKVRSVPELAQRIYSDTKHRTTIASLSPLVSRAAEHGDASAMAIVAEAARDLAMLVVRAATIMGMEGEPIALAVAGGVLVGSEHLRSALTSELDRQGIRGDMKVVDEALVGCLRLAGDELSSLGLVWR